ncbi:hypothetical protein SNE40_018290 [Patella caerulea]|uniref:Uncharacterized protein n=1 Tax=Patella caerulea TaxID=87958 RepID=A0AAN8PGY5_PATCE
MEKEVSGDIGIHGYEDDHALRKSFCASNIDQERIAMQSLEENTSSIKIWMGANRLKLNLYYLVTGNSYRNARLHLSTSTGTPSIDHQVSSTWV